MAIAQLHALRAPRRWPSLRRIRLPSASLRRNSQRAGHQKLSRLAQDGLLERRRVLTVGGILGRTLADIEDVFDLDDYLMLYNGAFATNLKSGDLKGTDPITSRLARHAGVDRFDHGRPADFLLRNKSDLLPNLRATTLDQFEKVIAAINATLGP